MALARTPLVLALALALLATLAQLSTAAPADGVILVRGNKMYNHKTGERFFIKGVRTVIMIAMVMMWTKMRRSPPLLHDR